MSLPYPNGLQHTAIEQLTLGNGACRSQASRIPKKCENIIRSLPFFFLEKQYFFVKVISLKSKFLKNELLFYIW
jgi:hypothetical protein